MSTIQIFFRQNIDFNATPTSLDLLPRNGAALEVIASSTRVETIFSNKLKKDTGFRFLMPNQNGVLVMLKLTSGQRTERAFFMITWEKILPKINFNFPLKFPQTSINMKDEITSFIKDRTRFVSRHTPEANKINFLLLIMRQHVPEIDPPYDAPKDMHTVDEILESIRQIIMDDERVPYVSDPSNEIHRWSVSDLIDRAEKQDLSIATNADIIDAQRAVIEQKDRDIKHGEQTTARLNRELADAAESWRKRHVGTPGCGCPRHREETRVALFHQASGCGPDYYVLTSYVIDLLLKYGIDPKKVFARH